MARGRMINKTLARSRKFQKLDSDFNRLLYCMILPFLDRDGRAEADPLLIKADSFPLRSDITEEVIQRGLEDLHNEGLINLYTADGEQLLECGGFRDNQEGLRYEREPESRIPAAAGTVEPSGENRAEPTKEVEEAEENDTAGSLPEACRSNAGVDPAECRSDAADLPVEEKRREEKEKRKESPRPAAVLVTESVKHWNSCLKLPPCKYTVANLPDIREVIVKFDTFTEDEINQAIDYLIEYWDKIPVKFRPRSFQRFIIRSLDSWLPSAHPWERFQPDEIEKSKGSSMPHYKPPEDNRPEASEDEAEQAFEALSLLTRRSRSNEPIDYSTRKDELNKQAEHLKAAAV